MSHFQPALASREFYATASGKAKTLILFGGLAALSGWSALLSRSPEFLSDTSIGQLAFIRDFFRMFPAGVAPVSFCLLSGIFVYAFVKTAARMKSSLPELILSEAGINAYPNLRANRHGYISWDDLASVSTYNRSAMIFYGKRAGFMGKRTVLAVNLSEIGVTKKEMDALLDAYNAAGNRARQSGRAPVDFVYPALKPKAADTPSSRQKQDLQPQLVTRPSAAMAGAATPSFGTRRNS